MVDEQGKPAFNNPAGVKALEWMVQTVDEGVTNPASVTYVEEDVRNVFSQGQAAFALNWNYMYDWLQITRRITGNWLSKNALMPAFAEECHKVSRAPQSMVRWVFQLQLSLRR